MIKVSTDDNEKETERLQWQISLRKALISIEDKFRLDRSTMNGISSTVHCLHVFIRTQVRQALSPLCSVLLVFYTKTVGTMIRSRKFNFPFGAVFIGYRRRGPFYYYFLSSRRIRQRIFPLIFADCTSPAIRYTYIHTHTHMNTCSNTIFK